MIKYGLLILLLVLIISPSMATAIEQSDNFLSPQGPVAAAQKDQIIWVTALTMIAILPVFILVPLILIKYRRRNTKALYCAKWSHSGPLEIIMWGVPIILVAIISCFLWTSTHKLDPYAVIDSPHPVLKIQVVGLDWKWLFIYPDLNIATVGEIAIPVDYPITLTLTTDTVMQSFSIPALAGQIYAMPGMTTKLNVLASQPAKMEGENTQYNGAGFAQQKFMTLSMPKPEFDQWVQKVKRNAVDLNGKSYKKLALRSTRAEVYKALGTPDMPNNILYFNVKEKNFFNSILHRYHGNAPILRHEQPGTKEYGQ